MVSSIEIISILFIRCLDIVYSIPRWFKLNKDFTKALPRLSKLYSYSLFFRALDAFIKKKMLVRELNSSLKVKPELNIKFLL